jgi:hypothetical protein
MALHTHFPELKTDADFVLKYWSIREMYRKYTGRRRFLFIGRFSFLYLVTSRSSAAHISIRIYSFIIPLKRQET